MPPLPPAARCLRCVYSGTYGNAKWANVFYVQYTSGPVSQADLTTLTTGLRDAWDTHFKALHSASCTLTQTTTVDLSSDTGLSGVNNTSSTGTVATGTPLPANVACVISWKIARRYRGGHPRMYLTGQTSANSTGQNNWSGTWVSSVKTAADAWINKIYTLTTASSGLLTPICLSYYAGHQLRSTPLPQPITTSAVHTRVDTQRRRLGREVA